RMRRLRRMSRLRWYTLPGLQIRVTPRVECPLSAFGTVPPHPGRDSLGNHARSRPERVADR
ncbi:hypothetical protein, partial [Nocardia fusca]|uniref:hypothetical protein n=1 Tax=Nocardia fusca TaxID=941183 RepID=UPI000ACE0017